MRMRLLVLLIMLVVSSVGHSVDFGVNVGLGHSKSKIKSENSYSYDLNAPTATFGGEILFESFSLLADVRNSRYFFSSKSRGRNIEMQLSAYYHLGLFFVGGGISNSLLQIENDDQKNYSFSLFGPNISSGLKYSVSKESLVKAVISHYASHEDSDKDVKDISLERSSIDFVYLMKL